ncbi:MAG: hypothetical protein JWP75_3540 [Frondihabitans sp.]|nr:hypothetical protein [Frondihabitans sp.]
MSRGLITIMATITHLGLIVLTIGLIFYVTDHDVIVERDATPYLGPAMALASMACVFFALARSFGVAERDAVTPGILRPALASALVSYVGMLIVGSGVYALIRSDALSFVLFAARYVGSPFVDLSSAWAGIVVAAFLLLARFDNASEPRQGGHDEL